MTGEGGQDPGTFITVPSFPLKASMLLGVAAVIWIAVYFLIDPKYQAVTALVGAAAAGVGALLGAYYAGQMLRTQIRQHEVAIAQRNNDQSRERMQVALHYGERWSDPNIFHAKQVCLEIMKIARDDRGPEEVCKFLDSDETDNIGKILNTSQQKQVNMGQLLNFLEEFSIAVMSDVADEAMAKRIFRGVLREVCHATSEWRKQERTKRQSPKLWVELETLNNKWQR